MLFLGIWDSIETIFIGLLRKLIMWVISFVYQLIAFLYNLFDYMTKVRILSGNNESLALDIYERIQVILAVVMVFYVTFEFVKYIVNPDSFSDKEKGGAGLLKRILIVLLLMAFTPKIFGVAYELQNRIISSNVIPKVLIKDFDSSYYNGNVGGEFSSDLLGLFYKPFKTSDGNVPVGRCSNDKTADEVVNNNLNLLAQNGKMTNATTCISDTGKDVREGNETIVAPFLIDLGFGAGLIPLVVGGFMVWMLFTYCMEAGRVIIQFVFLQIIAPIPVLSYIAPGKDGMFNKWVKQCVTTYMDMFIRLFIIYLVMMFGQILVKIDIGSILSGVTLSDGSLIPTFIKIFLIIGLMLFAMKAPKMIKELLPGGSNAASGDFGLKSREFPKPVTRAAGAALGAGYGAVRSGISRGMATRQRNKEMKDKLRSEGKPTNAFYRASERMKARGRSLKAGAGQFGARAGYSLSGIRNIGKSKDERVQARTSAAEKFNKAKAANVAAKNALAEHNVTRGRGGAVFQGAVGAVTGAASGLVTGAKTTKMTELTKTISNVNKSVNEKIIANERWITAGGGSFFDKISAKIAVPGMSQSEILKRTVDTMKQEAKTYERISSQELKTNGALDKVTSKIESKMIEGARVEMGVDGVKSVLNGVKTPGARSQYEEFLKTLGYDSSGSGNIELKKVFDELETNLSTAQSVADSAAREGDELKIKEANKNVIAAKNMRDELRKAFLDRVTVESAAGLHGGLKIDGLNQAVITELQNARLEPKTRDAVMKVLERNHSDIDNADIWKRFRDGNYSAFSEAEKIKVAEYIEELNKALKEVAGNHSIDASSISAEVGVIENGAWYQQAQADKDAAGGKK